MDMNINNITNLNIIINQYNLNKDSFRIKYIHDYSIICTVWFINITINNINSYGQAVNKNEAINIAIKNLSDKLYKKI